jgi:hypothetical protein
MVTEALPAISVPGEHLQMSVTSDGIAIITIDSKAEKVGDTLAALQFTTGHFACCSCYDSSS